ncbi:MAG: ABC transporter permease [Patescibacteria group bacterium]|nr:ABC transporter permease [Patescibacteria group bacterium]
MISIIKRVFLDKWRSVLIYVFSSLAFSEMYVALYPMLRDQLSNLEGFLEVFPKEFMEAFGFTAETMSFATVESLMATEMFSFIWPIILIILAASLAGYNFAGDIEKGTIELTLAQPVSRIKIFLGRYFAGAVLITIFVLTTVFGIIPLAAMHKIDFNFEAYVKMSILGVLFALAVYAVATFLSVLFSEKGKATFGVVGVLITMYSVKIVSGLKEELEFLRYTSFFYYFDTGAALVKTEYQDWAILVFALTIIIFSLLALVRFKKRDIAV